jgi:hypothetical protein
MNIYKNNLLFSIILYFYTAFFINSVADNNILRTFDTDIEIRTEKSRFITQETIVVYIKIINRDEDGPNISQKIHERLIIEDSKGVRYKNTIMSNIIGFQSMEKGEYETYLEINYQYGIHNRADGSVSTYLPNDKYTIKCIWKEHRHEPIVSNTINIVISEPKGKELKVLRLFREANKYRKQKKWTIASNKYDEIYEKYPNSVYTPNALYNHCFIYKYILKNKNKLVYLKKQILEKYPDCYFNYYAIDYMIRYYKREDKPEEGKKYFKKLAQETKSKKLIEFINEEINRFDNAID